MMEASSHDDDDDDDNNEDDDIDPYSHLIQSITSPTGLEVAIQVRWPGLPPNKPFLHLDTRLSPPALAPLFSGTQWAGTRVWQAAIVTLQYLLIAQEQQQQQQQQQQQHQQQPLVSGNSIVWELGCGLGVPGMILHALVNCHVVLTDKEELVQQLQTNVTHNFGDECSRIQAQALEWSADGARMLAHQCQHVPTIVLVCDGIFEPLYGQSWKQLLECQQAILELNPHTYMLVAVERRNYDGITHYLDAAHACPQISRIERIDSNNTMSWPLEIELYRLYGHGSFDTTTV